MKFNQKAFEKRMLDIIRRPKPMGAKPDVLNRLKELAREKKPKV